VGGELVAMQGGGRCGRGAGAEAAFTGMVIREVALLMSHEEGHQAGTHLVEDPAVEIDPRSGTVIHRNRGVGEIVPAQYLGPRYYRGISQRYFDSEPGLRIQPWTTHECESEAQPEGEHAGDENAGCASHASLRSKPHTGC